MREIDSDKEIDRQRFDLCSCSASRLLRFALAPLCACSALRFALACLYVACLFVLLLGANRKVSVGRWTILFFVCSLSTTILAFGVKTNVTFYTNRINFIAIR